MKAKAVYIVSSDSSDIYLEQTYLSILSLRKHNPDAAVAMVVDAKTDGTLYGERARILDSVNAKIVVPVPSQYNKVQSSRFLKTSLREYISGDFLFIDSDTIICDDFSGIDSFEGEIGAVINEHVPISRYYDSYGKRIKKYAKEEGWHCSDEVPHYNSGVMFVRDTPFTHAFFTAWHNRWKETLNKYNRHIDQSPLAFVNECFGYPIKELPAAWNCQILRYGIPYLRDAKIIHYYAAMYSSDSVLYASRDKNLYKGLLGKDSLPEEFLRPLDNPKLAFVNPTRLCTERELKFLSGEMAQICLFHPGITRVLDILFRLLIIIKAPFSRLKAAMVSANNTNMASR